jgi:hypothetical protein
VFHMFGWSSLTEVAGILNLEDKGLLYSKIKYY